MSNPLEQLISSLSPEKRAVLAELLRPAPEPIAIIGMSCRFPGGATTPEAFWNLLHNQVDAITEIPDDRWDSASLYDPSPDAPGKMYTRWGGFLPELGMFDASFFNISPKEATRMDPQQRLLLEVVWEALEHAGQSADRLAGSQTGVFIGLVPDDYTLLQVDRTNPAYADDPYFTSGSSSSMATGRISYLLDLQGPNMAIDTACSSSLVATHLASQSLRNKECDLALVGGVNAIVLPEVMVKLCKMRMLASDGRCKTFDAAADGFALGEGCGVIVLKRLSDALRDNDQIMAVIRGSAVNEDGRSASQTAPNGLAQQAVIRKALASAGLTPEQISYVEAHGSGTALGDPIEVEAIGAVLCKDRSPEQPLTIGTVKTNIGHLVGAAGVAGLIKTTLMLQHQAIPAHLNLKEPSPGIDWNAYPLSIPQATVPWTTNGTSRAAGVSSFGWSGTNSHIVLAEAPPRAAADPSRPYQLLVLSAKTESALNTAIANLAAHLEAHPELELADVAYTLQLGRAAFSYRWALVCDDRDAALGMLRSGQSSALPARYASTQRPVAFMFPGVGDHYVGMAQGLYTHEPSFRATVDRCCALLQPELGVDLAALLFPADRAAPVGQATPDLRALLGRTSAGTPDDGLRDTAVAQPAVFVIEYALATLLQTWGIQPQALLGYSVGEYVAATLAGVLSLDDALKLVATRARLIAALPAGAMLTVFLSEAAVQPFLSATVNLAVVTSPTTCVLAGPPSDLDALAADLRAQDIACRPVATTHAFHSTQLAPLMAEVTALVRTLALRPPQIPYLSNVTGTWITAAEATDPTYWARHMVEPVRFADGVAALLATPEQVILEVGPGQALASFVKQHPACARERFPQVISTLPAVHEQGSAQAALLRALGNLWQTGVTIDWAALYAGERRQRVPLPTYPFERQHFWVEPATPLLHSGTVPLTREASHVDLMSVPKQDPDDWFYLSGWRQSAPYLPATEGLLSEPGTCWLIFQDECGVSATIAAWLAAQNQDVIVVRPGAEYANQGAGYTIHPRQRADYERLLRDLRAQGKTPGNVLHAWTVSAATQSVDLETIQDLGFHSLLALAQVLGDQALEHCRITILSSDTQQVTGTELICPEKATVIGPTRIVPFEYPALKCQNIDIIVQQPGSWQAEALLIHLLGELTHDSQETVVALRDDRRWTQTLEPIKLPAAQSQPPLRQRGVYLITGGLGGIGLAIAEDLARTVQARLVLLGRSALPSRAEWAEIVARNGSSGDLGRRIRQVQHLEALGAETLVVQADVTDAAQVQTAIRQAIAHFGTINGVIHAAGVPGQGLISLKTPEQAERVFAPKVRGTLVLAEAVRDLPLDFLALFSSVASVTGGGAGQVDYCAANAFLDAYAVRHARDHGMTVAIGWGEWQWNAWEYAMSGYSPEMQDFFRSMRRTFGMTFDEGAEAFRRALARRLPSVFVATQDLRHILALLERSSITSFMPTPSTEAAAYPRPELGTSYVAPRNELEQTIAAVWSELLGIAEIGINDNFFDLGGNSLIGFELLTKLRKRLDVDPIPAYMLYEAPSVSAMALFFTQDQAADASVEERQGRGAKRRERQAQRKRSS